MLELLCGHKNIERILIFLFINGRCYGMQLQRIFDTPLTPLQKTLSRLEKGGLLTSHYEGRTRIYHFNQTYPLLSELEPLLKKAYILLPSHEKRLYHIENGENKHTTKNLNTLLEFWEKLSSIKELTFSASSQSKGGAEWNGRGKGKVTTTKEGSNILLFNESGSWKGKDGGKTSFSNRFRWTLDRLSKVIALEHLRYGLENPVFLFHLIPSTQQTLSSLDSYLCNEDSYFGQASFDNLGIKLTWRIIGPKKNEKIDYCYA